MHDPRRQSALLDPQLRARVGAPQAGERESARQLPLAKAHDTSPHKWASHHSREVPSQHGARRACRNRGTSSQHSPAASKQSDTHPHDRAGRKGLRPNPNPTSVNPRSTNPTTDQTACVRLSPRCAEPCVHPGCAQRATPPTRQRCCPNACDPKAKAQTVLPPERRRRVTQKPAVPLCRYRQP